MEGLWQAIAKTADRSRLAWRENGSATNIVELPVQLDGRFSAMVPAVHFAGVDWAAAFACAPEAMEWAPHLNGIGVPEWKCHHPLNR